MMEVLNKHTQVRTGELASERVSDVSKEGAEIEIYMYSSGSFVCCERAACFSSE